MKSPNSMFFLTRDDRIAYTTSSRWFDAESRAQLARRVDEVVLVYGFVRVFREVEIYADRTRTSRISLLAAYMRHSFPLVGRVGLDPLCYVFCDTLSLRSTLDGWGLTGDRDHPVHYANGLELNDSDCLALVVPQNGVGLVRYTFL